ncbi:Dam family site-specific DNA-(adenine-N6)-methyltransferase [uncultured Prevotella sp.]|uniref:DNA adenine methylase n=1 Tax=uncultured Prevotella sp. TaxID=159272 RepID=UPI0025864E49|nr:Dam family site-specific DNA-(adenine-N6)-methyltransferase [uncultured Prevotella sp.]
MTKEVKRSPLFYVGDKYKLITEIRSHFPQKIKKLVEPFVGGGSVFMNVPAQEYLLNDLNAHVVGLHKYLCKCAFTEDVFFKNLYDVIDSYGLSCSFLQKNVPLELKKKFVKTYYARFNKQGYQSLRANFISSGQWNKLELYVLLVYGFNHMLRFNKQGIFNLPVGNVDYNANVNKALLDYFEVIRESNLCWQNYDFRDFFKRNVFTTDDLIYLDPPYLISSSEYNKQWTSVEEVDLLKILDELDVKNIKFAISNVTYYRGKVNEIFLKWSQQYNVHSIKSNYISYHDNTKKQFQEVLVTNF